MVAIIHIEGANRQKSSEQFLGEREVHEGAGLV
jgi:hypothetical protein